MTISIIQDFSWLSRIKECVMMMAEAVSPSAGKREAEHLFAQCLGEHDAMLRRICLGYAGSAQDLEDLYQDVLVNVWRSLPSFRGDSSLKTWVYRIALNTCVSTVRTRRRQPAAVSLTEIITLQDPSQEKRDTVRDLYDCISELGPIDKALMMMWLDEYSYEDIACTVGISRSAVATRLHRAKDKLRANIRD